MKLWRCRSAGRSSSSAGSGTGGRGTDTYGRPRGPDAVEHVRSEGDGDEEIFGVADAHYVAGFVLREPVCAGVHAGFLGDQLVFINMARSFRRTLGNRKLCPLHRTVHLWLHQAYLSGPSPHNTLSSSQDPNRLE